MDLTFPVDRSFFNVRVAGVVIAGGRLLLQGDARYPFLVPPGGRCKLHEPSRAAAARELREELGRDLEVGRLLWVIENFFDLDGLACHEIGFFYAARLPPGDPLLAFEHDFPGSEAMDWLFYRWAPLAELPGLEIYPHVLRTRCASLPATTEHLVVDQRQTA